MVECWLPYGRTESHVSVPLRDLLEVVGPEPKGPTSDPVEIIRGSLRNPLGAKPLHEKVERGVSTAIAIDGTIYPHLAAASSSTIVGELIETGLSKDDIVIVVGNGCRDRSEPKLLEALEGEQMLEGVEVVEHSRNSSNLTELGRTSKGTNVVLDSRFTGTDVRIVVGEIVLDAHAGFKGAPTTILPALSSMHTIEMNRSRSFDRGVAPGEFEENPVLEDILETARKAEIDMTLNLVAGPHGELLGACSGGVEEAWRQAVSDLGSSFRVEAKADADIIVVSAGGSRFDFDLYHGVWALRSALDVAKRGASIILLAECPEGLGAEGLSKLAHVDILDELKRRYILGGEAVHLIKSTLRTSEIFLVSALPGILAEPLGLKVYGTANGALREVVRRRRGRRTLVLTHGCSTLPVVT
jgi:nickel-dependent lactate racemase